MDVKFPSIFLFLFCYLPSPNVGLSPSPPGLTTHMAAGQMPVGEQQTMDQITRQILKHRLPRMCGQYNVRVIIGDNTEQRTHTQFHDRS